MDNRVAGFMIVAFALIFLWLYDTGRWQDIQPILQGRVPTSNPTLRNTGFNTTGGSINNGYYNQGIPEDRRDYANALCNAYPETCPYVAGLGILTNPGQFFETVEDIVNPILGIFGINL